MTGKQSRKLDKLRRSLEEARTAREGVSVANRAVVGTRAGARLVAALSSVAGMKAIEAELDALRAERRALKKLLAFALRRADEEAEVAAAASRAEPAPARAAERKAEPSPKDAAATAPKRARKPGGLPGKARGRATAAKTSAPRTRRTAAASTSRAGKAPAGRKPA
jgi:hypothetical protein